MRRIYIHHLSTSLSRATDSPVTPKLPAASEAQHAVPGPDDADTNLKEKEEPLAMKSIKQENEMLSQVAVLNAKAIRYNKFNTLLATNPVVDLVPLHEIRGSVWKLLLGYLPASLERRDATLARKRSEYQNLAAENQHHLIPPDDQSGKRRVCAASLPFMRDNALFRCEKIQRSLERILYCWAIRHPASGYVQGMPRIFPFTAGINDLATPFISVFFSPADQQRIIAARAEESKAVDAIIAKVEADTFWCLTKLLDGIQDNYTTAQPGIQRQIVRLHELVQRIDAPLSRHLDDHDIQFIQFSFRWMNCLLMREISLPHIVRMWDTYLAEGETTAFSDFHLYVCAAFLARFSAQIRAMREFQDILVFLQQGMPEIAAAWNESDVELLLSEAFMNK
ncbi:MAG: hypothetical protein SGCHY_002606 [Lobulomycetales sp.]